MSAALRVAVRRAAIASPRVVAVATNITRAYRAAAQSAAISSPSFNASVCTAVPLLQVPRRFYAALPSHTLLTMPSLSPTMTRGKIAAWNVKEGESFKAGKSLADVETDKATVSFDATDDGVLAKIIVAEGQEADVNQPVGVVVDEAADVAAFKSFVPKAAAAAAPAAAPAAATPAATPAPATTTAAAPAPAAATNERIIASPLAKMLAEKAGLSLKGVSGTGPNNRITKADVESLQAAAAAAPVAPAATPVVSAAPAVSSGSYTDIPLTNVRTIIASRLTESKQKIPHYYLSIDVKVDELLALRKRLNDSGNGEYKLSVNDFVVKASAAALVKVPAVNSSWQDTYIRQYSNADISVAVSTDNGLITPIVFAANTLGLASIASTTKELADRARQNKLKPQEFQGGTFTISNLGMFGIKSFTAIINPPQACILAVGSSEERLVPDAKSTTGFRTANVMNVTLSCDHRVVDGAVGAQWLAAFKKFIEKPETLLL